jgi:hypothetical protein
MSEKATAQGNAATGEVVQMLVNVRGADTVYGDLYLRRARELLATVLSQAQYDAFKGAQGNIDAVLKQIRAATTSQDWKRVESLAAQVDDIRRSTQEKAALTALAVTVYDTCDVKIDPFSPGFDSLPGFNQDLAGHRDALVANLKELAGADPPLAPLYESRRKFFAGLALASGRPTTASSSEMSSAEIEQLAVEAAQRGDTSQLRLYAHELSARRAKEASAGPKSETKAAAVGRAAYQCPVDLSAPFSDDVVKRAGTLGLVVARTEPPPQLAPLLDYVTTHIWQPNMSDIEPAHEGTTRVEVMVDQSGFPPDMSGPLKDLVGQFLQNAFINSGGARYIPGLYAETVLVEDFPETEEPPATSELLSILGLTRRRALARRDIEAALLEHGATVLRERLLLDPTEFRLVCIPLDLYIALGRDRGWGRQQRWTHFDGYQVFRTGRLRALAGGDARYGGLSDLVSIEIGDQRQGVIARFAVIRRARQVARWL